jgi:hypothetical protein
VQVRPVGLELGGELIFLSHGSPSVSTRTYRTPNR